MRSLLPLAIGSGLALFACRGSETLSAPDATTLAESPSAPACVAELREKLGVPFLHVCPAKRPGAKSLPSEAIAPFWMSTTPITCSRGDHDNVRCAPAVILTRPRLSDPPSLAEVTSPLAMVVEADIAHQICTMRFGGRLPTRKERSFVRETSGFATTIVTARSDGHRVSELVEWVTEKPCDQPTILGPDCAARTYPWDATAGIPWASLVRCEGSALRNPVERVVVDVGAECPSSAKAPNRFDCALRASVSEGADVRSPGVGLTCSPPGEHTAPRLPADALNVAAFRCAIAEWM